MFENKLKVHGPIFQNFVFLFYLMKQDSKDVNLKFWLKRSSCFDVPSNFVLQLPISYCSLIMVTITRHIFINNFQTEYISAMKFDRGYEKNMSFLVIWYHNLQKFEKIRLGSFKSCQNAMQSSFMHFLKSQVYNLIWKKNRCLLVKSVKLMTFRTQNVTSICHLK